MATEPTTPEQQRLFEVHGELARRFGRLFAVLIRLPRPIAIEFRGCRDSAYYSVGRDTITVCYGFLLGLERTLRTEVGVRGISVFTILHELAHALIDQLELPVVGNKEEAADRFALSLLMGNETGARLALGAARYFRGDGAGVASAEAFADEHPVDLQRFYTILCAVFGAHPEVFHAMVDDDVLPESRRARCAAEMRTTRVHWNKLLAPYSNVESGATFFE